LEDQKPHVTSVRSVGEGRASRGGVPDVPRLWY
jgi:hypothetical protein